MGLTSSPTPGYPGLDLYRYVSLIRAVHNGVHAVDHRLLQPDLYVRCPFRFALNDYLIVCY